MMNLGNPRCHRCGDKSSDHTIRGIAGAGFVLRKPHGFVLPDNLVRDTVRR